MADTLTEAMALASVAATAQEIQIDNDLRTITIPSGLVLGVYNDKKTHRVHFRMPKEYSGIDLSDFSIRINYQNAAGEGDIYNVSDNAVDGEDITFSWLVGRFAYVAEGNVTFSVCLRKCESDGTVTQEFNTTTAILAVLEGYEPNDIDEKPLTDIYYAVSDSQKAAKTSETNASTSASAAANSASAAATSAQKAANSVALPAVLSNSYMHRNAYRGNNLGNSVTEAQYNAIKSGGFDDLFIGDYWVIGGVTYRIADMDYWLNKGDTPFKTHHLVIVNDSIWRDGWHSSMNDTATTNGAYVGSKMYTDIIPAIDATLEKAFGAEHVLSHREHLQNATTNGCSSGGTWFGVKSVLMNEPMVYGHYVYEGSSAPSGTIVNRYTIDNHQLALFRLNSSMINCNRSWWWLRDVVSSTLFAGVHDRGGSSYSGADCDANVRVAFPLGA